MGYGTKITPMNATMYEKKTMPAGSPKKTELISDKGPSSLKIPPIRPVRMRNLAKLAPAFKPGSIY